MSLRVVSRRDRREVRVHDEIAVGAGFGKQGKQMIRALLRFRNDLHARLAQPAPNLLHRLLDGEGPPIGARIRAHPQERQHRDPGQGDDLVPVQRVLQEAFGAPMVFGLPLVGVEQDIRVDDDHHSSFILRSISSSYHSNASRVAFVTSTSCSPMEWVVSQ